LLAQACVQCGAPLTEPEPIEPRYHVQRAGAQPSPAGGAAPDPAPGAGLPRDIPSLDESAQVWYCKIGGQTVGPCLAADIRDAFAKGQINGEASVGVRGHKAWYPIRSLPQFAQMITGVGLAPSPRAASLRPGPAGAPPPGPAAGTAAAGQGAGVAPGPGAPPAPTSACQPAPGAAPPGRPTTSATGQREDETLVVPPLPPPSLMEVGNQTAQVHDPAVAAWRAEVAALRRKLWILGALTALLGLCSAVLLALLLSG
jgi:hypothetical protein